jgi:hypothetical protein
MKGLIKMVKKVEADAILCYNIRRVGINIGKETE